MLIVCVFIQLLHQSIDVIERKPHALGGMIVLKCKDFRCIQLDVKGQNDFSAVADSLEQLAAISNIELLYPFFYSPQFEAVTGWDTFSVENEFRKFQSDDWRISYANSNFSLCSSYPKAVIVPKFVTDETLKSIASFRSLGRFPVLSYLHKTTKAVLLRSGQPLVGPHNKRCKEDERMINTILGPGKRGYIIDTRAVNLAQLAKTKGGGYELEAHYPLWRRVHRQICRHTILLESLQKLVEACNDTQSSMEKWLSRVESSGWLNQVKEVLTTACLVAQCMNEESASVLVHGAEGMDSTLQVTSLTQVILDPDTRTIHGFEALIEREWLQAGHPFSLRCSNSAYAAANKNKDQSPAFLLFLDCVFQIYNQYPCSFEFGEEFLVMLFRHAYASQFGTFLGNDVKHRTQLRLEEKTVSLWSHVNRPSQIAQYINSTYEPNPSVIWPSVAPQSIILWESLFLRWIIQTGAASEAQDALSRLRAYESELEKKVLKLRKQLRDSLVVR